MSDRHERPGEERPPAPAFDDATVILRRNYQVWPPVSRLSSPLRKAATGERSIHPALVPGISVEDTDKKFPTNTVVFAVALLVSLAVVAWAFIAPDNINDVGTSMQAWVVQNLGWMFTAVVLGVTVFMLVVGYAPSGRIRLGADDSEPEFSTLSWISMLFAAGLGIGLIFYGPMEPLIHFQSVPPAFDGDGIADASMDAAGPAIAQALLHQASFPWVIYAFVGGAIAYAAYRRGRLPLISSVFEPVFPNSPNHPVGKVIDIFAVLVTLFGTATSLGIGALQIQAGASIITGQDLSGNGVIVVIISILTALFVWSAVAGVKTGIRIMSNMNMGLVVFLALFVLVTGPTVFLLDLVPNSVLTFFGSIPDFFSVAASQGEVEAEFVTAWTILFWAWWISWSPFVGVFFAKISKGRTLREFVTMTVFAPAAISVGWYVVFGGTAIWQVLEGFGLPIQGAGENVMFDLLGNLPWSVVMQVVALLAVIIFFITAGDSATNVMGSMSQNGRPVPANWATVTWGVALGLIALALLLAGGQNALSGLQSIMVSMSVPFAIIIIGMAIVWARDLITDPLIIRRRYGWQALRKGVARGIDEHGDDFVFGASKVSAEEGAGAEFDYAEDESLTDWYTSHKADKDEVEDGDDGEEAPTERP